MLNGFPEHYVFQLFAELLDYPKSGLGALARQAARECFELELKRQPRSIQ